MISFEKSRVNFISTIISPMKFSDWINRKYVEWRGNAVGHERTVTEYAEMIGVSQPLMSSWMRAEGKQPRTAETINKLVKVYGYEVYQVLGYDTPTVLDEIPSDLPPDVRQRLMEDQREFIRRWLREQGYHRKK
jgi:transcriptional regulator with XRE-family HTH domain